MLSWSRNVTNWCVIIRLTLEINGIAIDYGIMKVLRKVGYRVLLSVVTAHQPTSPPCLSNQMHLTKLTNLTKLVNYIVCSTYNISLSIVVSCYIADNQKNRKEKQFVSTSR